MKKSICQKSIEPKLLFVESNISWGAHVTPHEIYFRHKKNMAHIRFIDIIAYVHVSNKKRKKLDAKSEKCMLVGYSHEHKGYKCYKP